MNHRHVRFGRDVQSLEKDYLKSQLYQAVDMESASRDWAVVVWRFGRRYLEIEAVNQGSAETELTDLLVVEKRVRYSAMVCW